MDTNQRLRVLSVYQGFFAGGARALHSSVIGELHTTSDQEHSVLTVFREMRRERLCQPMTSDARYRALRRAGVRVGSLGRTTGSDHTAPDGADARVGDRLDDRFDERELALAARHLGRADVVLSLKEQPLSLLNQAELSGRPVVVCLHRSDPENQGAALADLRTAVAAGRVASVVCCAESTRDAYAAAGIPAPLLTVIENGVDLARFRPAPSAVRQRFRHRLGVPSAAHLVVFAARYDGMKNVPLLLASAREFLRRDPLGHIVLCGAGMSPGNPELRADIAAAFAGTTRLRRRLQCLGLRDDMRTVYAAADVVALTSSTGEAAPLCLIEGMMCGAIPVTTDVGDSASIVDGHGLVTAPDPAQISAAWSEAIARRSQWAPALDRARPRFSLARMAAAYGTLIERTAAPRVLTTSSTSHHP